MGLLPSTGSRKKPLPVSTDALVEEICRWARPQDSAVSTVSTGWPTLPRAHHPSRCPSLPLALLRGPFTDLSVAAKPRAGRWGPGPRRSFQKPPRPVSTPQAFTEHLGRVGRRAGGIPQTKMSQALPVIPSSSACLQRRSVIRSPLTIPCCCRPLSLDSWGNWPPASGCFRLFSTQQPEGTRVISVPPLPRTCHGLPTSGRANPKALP